MKKINIIVSLGLLVVGAGAVAHEPVKQKSKVDIQIASVVKSEKSLIQKAAEHSGGTDSKGCHTNHSTGVYHCHNPK